MNRETERRGATALAESSNAAAKTAPAAKGKLAKTLKRKAGKAASAGSKRAKKDTAPKYPRGEDID